MIDLVDFLLKNKINQQEAVHYLKLIVQSGSDVSLPVMLLCQYDLARCFEKGTGVRRSAQNALFYYKLAADNGDQLSQERLGDAYQNGELGLDKSP